MTGRQRLNIGLGAALIASLGLHLGGSGPARARNFEFFPDMVRTPRYNAFEANPNFDDGSTLRMPVPGTIPRGLPPLPPVDPKGDGPSRFHARLASRRARASRPNVASHTGAGG